MEEVGEGKRHCAKACRVVCIVQNSAYQPHAGVHIIAVSIRGYAEICRGAQSLHK